MKTLNLITRGDDAGSNSTANQGILEACDKGILRNVSFMVPCIAIEEAATMFAHKSEICCGLHITITAEWDRVRWGPVLPPDQVPSLVDEHGHFFKNSSLVKENNAKLDEMMAEIQAQFDRGQNLGFDFKYADLHMGVGNNMDGFPNTFDAWCTEHKILNYSHYHQRLPRVDTDGDPVDQLIAQLQAVDSGQYAVVGHPAYDTPEMHELGSERMSGAAIAEQRDWQRRWFTDSRILAYCKEHNVVPTRYDEAERLNSR
ncbi:MAG: ChbG/HpnK family deacetylase [Candidatus Latescibacteria bacterium]|jgi:hypothetical protein|nr:ChbG/HpnK family deacetylase [Candidatus Latescibacterota bacterium]